MGVESKERAAAVQLAVLLVSGTALCGLAVVFLVDGNLIAALATSLIGSAIVGCALLRRYGPRGRQHPSQIHRRWKSR